MKSTAVYIALICLSAKSSYAASPQHCLEQLESCYRDAATFNQDCTNFCADHPNWLPSAWCQKVCADQLAEDYAACQREYQDCLSPIDIIWEIIRDIFWSSNVNQGVF